MYTAKPHSGLGKSVEGESWLASDDDDDEMKPARKKAGAGTDRRGRTGERERENEEDENEEGRGGVREQIFFCWAQGVAASPRCPLFPGLRSLVFMLCMAVALPT